jgi:BolA family transcriptional regulator, general stress-responsive regulator
MQGLDICGSKRRGSGDIAPEEVADMSIETEIRTKLMLALEPTRLDILNESELHAGHRSSPGTGESHFRVLIVSNRFAGLNRVSRHRLVNETLEGLVGTKVHAFALKAYAPGESIT